MTTKALKEGMGSINVEETVSIDRIRKLAGIANGIENSIGQEVTHTSLNPEANVEEAVGSDVVSILALCDEVGCDPDHPVLADLIRYLDGDTIADFVKEFRSNHEYDNGLEFESSEIQSGQE
jgi:hypothetical protein